MHYAIAARIAVEKRIVGTAVKSLLDAGYKLSVSWERGYDRDEMLVASRKKARIMEAAFAADECHIFVHKPDQAPFEEGRVNCDGWIFCVFGNDGWDVFADYTTNLETVLGPANALANKIADEGR